MDWNARCFREHPSVDVGHAFAVRGLSKLKLPEESRTRYFNTYKDFLQNKPHYDVPSNLSPEKIWHPAELPSVRLIICHQAREETLCILNEQGVIIKEFDVNFGYDFKIHIWKDHIFAWGEEEDYLEDPIIIHKLQYNVEELAQAAKANTADEVKHCKLKLAKRSIPKSSPLYGMTAVYSMKSFGDYLWLMRVSSSIFVFHASNDLSQLQLVKYMDCYGNQLDISIWDEEPLFPEDEEDDCQEFPMSKIWKVEQYAITFSNYMIIWDACTGKKLAQFETESIDYLTKMFGYMLTLHKQSDGKSHTMTLWRNHGEKWESCSWNWKPSLLKPVWTWFFWDGLNASEQYTFSTETPTSNKWRLHHFTCMSQNKKISIL